MTYEKIAENIKTNICYNQPICSDGICKSTEENPCAIDIALECIEKQKLPMKPILEADGYADGELVYDTWYCPNCDKSYEVDYDSYNFCPNCGQKIDWEN